MRKKHSPHGNVGPTKHDIDLGSSKKRCNVCNYLNGEDGPPRAMFKDDHDKYGGYICNQCKRHPVGHEKDSWKREDWYQEAVEQSKHSVDGERDYDEMIEDLISDWEKSQDR